MMRVSCGLATKFRTPESLWLSVLPDEPSAQFRNTDAGSPGSEASAVSRHRLLFPQTLRGPFLIVTTSHAISCETNRSVSLLLSASRWDSPGFRRELTRPQRRLDQFRQSIDRERM